MFQSNTSNSKPHSRPNYYHTDGTGRDTYIHHDNGGLTA